MRLEQVNISRMTDAAEAERVSREKAMEAISSIVNSLQSGSAPAKLHWGHAGSMAGWANELVSIANRINGSSEG